MKKAVLTILIFMCLSIIAFSEDLPLSLIYPGELLGQATEEDRNLVIDTFKIYLNRSGKIESIVYSVEMPSVLLAVKNNKLTGDEVSKDASLDSKIKVGNELGYDYIFLPEISRDEKTFEVNINAYYLKEGRMQSYGAAMKPSDRLATDVNSAISGITIQLLKDIFSEVPNFDFQNDKNRKTEEEEAVDLTVLDAKELVKLAEKETKEENYSQAIVLITKAIDKKPFDPELRLKLADVYYRKQLYKEALDQFYNAINMGYRGEELYSLKQKYEARVRAEDYMKPAEDPEPENKNKDNDDIVIAPPKLENPGGEWDRQIEDSLGQADVLWKKGRNNDALNAYGQIVKRFPKDYRAYERIAMVYANSSRFSQCAKIIQAIEDRKLDYDMTIKNKRINTLSAVVSAYYIKMIGRLRNTKDYILANSSGSDVKSELNAESDRIYDTLNLINVLGQNSSSFYITNLKLTGNLLNSAISGLLDYIEEGDFTAIDDAENCLGQAEVRTKQIKF
ncbi:MAG: tetratricopeptide repeat protein [Armatimonadetes bacterium]|nr:tetratricopeptide repeat protein [Candidatus Hippobium faecium]